MSGQAGEPVDQPSYTCPRCEMTSYHPQDVEHQYCANCHKTRLEVEAEMAVRLPGRTVVELLARVPAGEVLKPGASISIPLTRDMVKSFKCIDCHFTTSDLEEMLDHQAHGKHSLRRRFWRWWLRRKVCRGSRKCLLSLLKIRAPTMRV